ncbi:hypothetical protein OCT63_19800 [Vibrio sp. RW]|uniref:hypothetical protein n=1 Tax=Vibrio sp. RW TaxID=2998833 RepID=UPI0022CDAE09|nr:hypothetical protein [Vibrio sp. RW]MDA0146474.1 hypothetical protein [Vibrio sp. RW]
MKITLQNVKNIQIGHIIGGPKKTVDLLFVSLSINEAGQFGNFAIADGDGIELFELVLPKPHAEAFPELVEAVRAGKTDGIVIRHWDSLRFQNLEALLDYIGLEGIDPKATDLTITDLEEVAA